MAGGPDGPAGAHERIGATAVVVDWAAEQGAENDPAFAWTGVGGFRRQVLQWLAGPALVVVPKILARHPKQMGLAEDDDPTQALLPQAASPAFHIALRIGEGALVSHWGVDGAGARVMFQGANKKRYSSAIVSLLGTVPSKGMSRRYSLNCASKAISLGRSGHWPVKSVTLRAMRIAFLLSV